MDFTKLSWAEIQDYLDQDPILNGPLSSTFNSKDKYGQAETLFHIRQTQPGAQFTLPVIDLYLASHYQGLRDRQYTQSEILRLPERNVPAFAQVFGFSAQGNDLFTNRERILRILRFLNLLKLPAQVKGVRRSGNIVFGPNYTIVPAVYTMEMAQNVYRQTPKADQKLVQSMAPLVIEFSIEVPGKPITRYVEVQPRPDGSILGRMLLDAILTNNGLLLEAGITRDELEPFFFRKFEPKGDRSNYWTGQYYRS